jgi:hypothetical protein
MRIRRNIAISDSGFIFNPDTGESFSTNEMAVKMFQLLKEDKTFEEIMAEILDEYHVDKQTFEKDYQDFIGMLKQYNLSEDEES